ncbi:MAG TPA: AMP-binding protein [Salinivirgaceae bacterium]|nr:AMP-binding protein [Salinivirgaceae bacterium]
MKVGNFVEMVERSIIQNWDLRSMSLYKGEGYTYGQVGEKILQFHQIFEKIGIKPNDKIALIGTNDHHWGTVYLATVTYGAVIVPILQDFHPNDVVHVVEHSDSLLLFVTKAIYEKLDKEHLKHLHAIILLDDFTVIESKNEDISLAFGSRLQKKLDLNKETFKLPKISNDELAVISYTSGTSGFSKGVMLPHWSLAANVQFGVDYIGLKPGDNIVSFLPLAHAYACAFEFLATFVMGCDITFLGKVPSPTIILQAFKEIRPRLIFSVPLIIEKIYRMRVKPKLSESPVKYLIKIPLLNRIVYRKINQQLSEAFGGNFIQIIIGGAALNAEVEDLLNKIGFRYTVGYGMTECGPLISYAPWNEHKKYSCGKPIPCLTVKIDSSDPQNIAGEILVKGVNVMKGYYKSPEITEATFTVDGWLRTGDLGIQSKDGFIFIKGRSKNMLLGPSGQNIYPEEIEAKINNMPYVLESLVIQKDGKLQALIVPDKEAIERDGVSNDELQTIMNNNQKHLNSHVPSYMNVTKFIIQDMEFEKTAKKSIKRYMYNS